MIYIIPIVFDWFDFTTQRVTFSLNNCAGLAVIVKPEEELLLCEILEGLPTYLKVNGCASRHCFVLSGHGPFVQLTSHLHLQGH